MQSLTWKLIVFALAFLTAGAIKKNFVLSTIAQSLFTAAFVLAIFQMLR